MRFLTYINTKTSYYPVKILLMKCVNNQIQNSKDFSLNKNRILWFKKLKLVGFEAKIIYINPGIKNLKTIEHATY